MSKGHPRHRDLPPRPDGEEALVPWLQRLAAQLVGREREDAERLLDHLGVRLNTHTRLTPWPPGRVGEGVAFRNTIFASVQDGVITAVHVDDW